MADVVLTDVSKSYGKGQTRALANVNLSIARGEFVVLLGPTGAGKTTTLRLIAGLERPDGGRIQIDGRDVSGMPPSARDIAFVFQQYSLYPHLTVYENLAFPLKAPGQDRSKQEIDARVRATARLVRIDHKLDNRATRLSGGEMQRVAIGRALVRQPSIYLMDEPLSSLDAKLRADMRLELKRIQRELGATLLYVTHDQIEAMTMADRIGILNQGQLVQVGTPREIYTEPANLYVAARLGQPAINILPRGLLPDAHLPRAAMTVGARTEHFRITRSAKGTALGKVDWIEHLGDQNHLHIKVGERRIVTLSQPDSELKAGDGIAIEYNNPLCFDANGARIGYGS